MVLAIRLVESGTTRADGTTRSAVIAGDSVGLQDISAARGDDSVSFGLRFGRFPHEFGQMTREFS
ncbi:hypothetical protein [Lentibacillus halophilus]|uniref:hypothetical protein n=1 Tax=Lentibacillus halophilus TaxID=295065 RepID=UPI0031DE73DC